MAAQNLYAVLYEKPDGALAVGRVEAPSFRDAVQEAVKRWEAKRWGQGQLLGIAAYSASGFQFQQFVPVTQTVVTGYTTNGSYVRADRKES